MPTVTLSTCQRDVFMASIPRYEYIHSYWTYILVYTSIYTNIQGFEHRILWLLFRRTLTALKRIVTLFPWKTVGLHVSSSSSSAICVLNMEDSPGSDQGSSSCTNHPQHRVCIMMWLQQRTWSAEYPLYPCFWLETQTQQSLICTASARILVSRWAALMQQQ